jgi:hypothetical protein
MCSLGSIMFDVSKKNLLLFSNKVSIKNCGGGHLVFFHWQCKLKTSTWPSNDRFYNIIINNQICPVVYEKTVLEISTNQITSLAMVAMLNFWLAQKQLCVKHHPMNIHAKVDSNGPVVSVKKFEMWKVYRRWRRTQWWQKFRSRELNQGNKS